MIVKEAVKYYVQVKYEGMNWMDCDFSGPLLDKKRAIEAKEKREKASSWPNMKFRIVKRTLVDETIDE